MLIHVEQMSGVGEALTVLSVLQSGYSVANTLTTYISDVKGAREDVQSLAAELDSTLRHLEELDKLATQNTSIKGWNANGEGLVKNCKAEADKVVKELIRLLSKSGNEIAIATDKVFNRDDIDLKIFNKATWPVFKPKVDLVKRELLLIKLNIFMAREVYNASTETKTLKERRKAKVRLGGLDRVINKTARQIDRAKSRQTVYSHGAMARAADNHSGSGDADEPSSADEELDADNSYSYYSYDDSDEGSVLDMDEVLAQAREEVELEAREALAKKEETEAAESALREEAVARYKQDLLDVLNQRKQTASRLTEALNKAFEPAPPPEQIRQFVHDQHLSEFSDETIKELADQVLGVDDAQAHPEATAPQASNNRYGLIHHASDPANDDRFVLTSRARRGLKKKSTQSASGLPSALLRHESHPDCARLLSINVAWLMRGREVYVEPVHVSMEWLVKHMKDEERKAKSSADGVPLTMRVWSRLPSIFHDGIAQWLRMNTNHASAWSLVFARADEKKPTRKTKVLRRLLGDAPDLKILKSVILVYRRSRFLEGLGHPSTAPASTQASPGVADNDIHAGSAARLRYPPVAANPYYSPDYSRPYPYGTPYPHDPYTVMSAQAPMPGHDPWPSEPGYPPFPYSVPTTSVGPTSFEGPPLRPSDSVSNAPTTMERPKTKSKRDSKAAERRAYEDSRFREKDQELVDSLLEDLQQDQSQTRWRDRRLAAGRRDDDFSINVYNDYHRPIIPEAGSANRRTGSAFTEERMREIQKMRDAERSRTAASSHINSKDEKRRKVRFEESDLYLDEYDSTPSRKADDEVEKALLQARATAAKSQASTLRMSAIHHGRERDRHLNDEVASTLR